MLAIIIPFYKISFFEKTLQSLANQKDQRFKVYIGDDASLNDPSELLQKYDGAFDFEYYRFENNLGGVSLTQQWERCIGLSQDEEWLMILGDDDVLGPNVISSFYENLHVVLKLDLKLFRFASRIIDSSREFLSETYKHPEFELCTDSYFRNFNKQTRSSLSEYIFKRSSYIKHKFHDFPLGWHSDDMAWIDFTDGGFVYTINNAEVYIRISDESISGKIDNSILKNKARRIFLMKISLKSKYTFTKVQIIAFLFELGILLKQQKMISISIVSSIFFQFIKMGSVYDGFRFLRRMFRSIVFQK
ncbi:glycosyltransferase family A protein [Flavobacterium algicola]|uniref:glycosyltransferase family A protein n=1 Tax=Flavobacterium algicola TaxID=556529 RepID=UPI001EFDE6C5|nr:glycosyltransferase family A protein [Flavobacterium algicola]MCG9793905.1 glycosyltransferase family 2 protein [Flavobacterium algicola]